MRIDAFSRQDRDNQVHKITAPILLCVFTEAGNDPHPLFFIQVRDGDGVARCTANVEFEWNDIPGQPYKWQVWDLKLDFLVFGAWVYTFGIYENPHDAQALSSFPFPIIFDAPMPQQ